MKYEYCTSDEAKRNLDIIERMGIPGKEVWCNSFIISLPHNNYYFTDVKIDLRFKMSESEFISYFLNSIYKAGYNQGKKNTSR